LEAKHQEMIRSAIDKLGKSSVKKKGNHQWRLVVSGKKKGSTKQKPQPEESDEEQPKRKNKKEDADWGPEKTEKK
jgi:hypothetical protein